LYTKMYALEFDLVNLTPDVRYLGQAPGV